MDKRRCINKIIQVIYDIQIQQEFIAYVSITFTRPKSPMVMSSSNTNILSAIPNQFSFGG